MIKNIKWLPIVALVFAACSSEEDFVADPNSSDGTALNAGSADFTNFVALGDSFAAGFSDNALFIEGQKNSYPNIMATQFALVGGGEFKNPFMSDNIGGFSLGGNQIPALGVRLYLAPGNVPTPVDGVSGTDITAKVTGPFNNFGIPGAKCTQLDLVGFGSPVGNPYFARMASSPSATVVDDALTTNPTFFSLWIGGNDVLGYATSGGLNSSPITPTDAFNDNYNSLIAKLTAGGRKGVIANLPYVNTLPYFTTVPTNPIPALPAASSGQLNLIFGGINQITTAMSMPSRFKVLTTDDGNAATIEATNPLLIIDESLPNLSAQITGALTPVLGAATAGFVGSIYGQARHASSVDGTKDFILLPTRSLIAGTEPAVPSPFNVRGVTFPLQDGAVLTAAEALEISQATDAYNITIQAAASANGLGFVDAKELMSRLSTSGIVANNYTLTSTYVTGGTFSLDGVHPSPRGYAFIANEFLKAINVAYGSNFKGVNVGAYRILYPKEPDNF